MSVYRDSDGNVVGRNGRIDPVTGQPYEWKTKTVRAILVNADGTETEVEAEMPYVEGLTS